VLFWGAEVIEGVLGCWEGGIGDAEGFFGIGVTRGDLDSGGFDVECLCDEGADCFVGFTGFGGGGDADFEAIAEHACDFAGGCAGDGFDWEEDFWHWGSSSREGDGGYSQALL